MLKQYNIYNGLWIRNSLAATDSNGHALFYVMEVSRSARVSPIGDGGILSWGMPFPLSLTTTASNRSSIKVV